MRKNNLKLKEIESAILELSPKEKKQLFSDLSKLMVFSQDDIALLLAAEKSFEFWNNPEDEVYDSL